MCRWPQPPAAGRRPAAFGRRHCCSAAAQRCCWRSSARRRPCGARRCHRWRTRCCRACESASLQAPYCKVCHTTIRSMKISTVQSHQCFLTYCCCQAVSTGGARAWVCRHCHCQGRQVQMKGVHLCGGAVVPMAVLNTCADVHTILRPPSRRAGTSPDQDATHCEVQRRYSPEGARRAASLIVGRPS